MRDGTPRSVAGTVLSKAAAAVREVCKSGSFANSRSTAVRAVSDPISRTSVRPKPLVARAFLLATRSSGIGSMTVCTAVDHELVHQGPKFMDFG